MISERSAIAYKDAAINGYDRMIIIPTVNEIEQVIFNGKDVEIKDAINCINESVGNEKMYGFIVPSYYDIPKHYMIITDENVIQLFPIERLEK